MFAEFHAAIEPEGVHLSLKHGELVVSTSQWAAVARDGGIQAAVALCYALIEAGDAEDRASETLISHPCAARLTPREAASFGMPKRAGLILDLRNEGTLDQRNFRLSYRWLRPNGQPIVLPKRIGAFLSIGGQLSRIPYEAFALVEGIDAFERAPVADPDLRYRAWAELQNLLPEEASSEVRASGYLRDVRIAYAGALSLDIHGDPSDLQFDPVLHAGIAKTSGPVDEIIGPQDDLRTAGEPRSLLPPALQETFARQRFPAFKDARARYAVGDGWYVVLDVPVQRALQVVRRVRDATPDIRREFVKNPRSYFRDALGADYDDVVIENLFLETAAYSERVQKIGLWQPKVLPWLVLSRNPWLPPERYGIFVAGNRIELSAGEIKPLISGVEAALSQGKATVLLRDHTIPATSETLEALRGIEAKLTPVDPDAPSADETASSPKPQGKTVLLIQDNLETLGFEASFEQRHPVFSRELPSLLKAELKPHQVDGVSWLQDNWASGRPGVLLADDMGLGKTLQALAFLAWVKEGMGKGLVRRGPLLTVAPTGLLANWEKEHELHLESPGLGHIVHAHGQDLRPFRTGSGQETDLAAPLLDYEKLAEADWILATYEAVRDYQHSFGKIPFTVIVFDEVQKTKTPGTLVTEAAKAMKGEFIIAMTGTPIENRLADLWCITDTVQPGLLGDLKNFSSRFEQSPDSGELERLKDRLVRGTSSRSAVMLRRLKADHLPGLPEKHEHVIERGMPAVQADFYRSAIQEARVNRRQGAILQVLQNLRVLSLHPLPPGAAPDAQYIGASARYSILFEVLDRIRDAGEKALVFLEFLEPQAYLGTLLQRRYQMPAPPLLINGSMTGQKRQERVDRFQSGLPGFDVILLSPRAGGIGITLTAANHVIHLSRWWNPAVEDQCTDRIYRIGQMKPVHVYYPIALFPDDELHSFDRRLHALLSEKRALSRELLLPPAATGEDAQRLYDETVGQGEAAQ